MSDTEKVLEIDDQLSKEKIMEMVEELDSTELEETDKYVMRELLRGKGDDLLFKTDLNMTQIKGIVRLLTIDKIMKAQSTQDQKKAERILESVPDYMSKLLMKLLVSKERKGRGEFIKAWIGNENKGTILGDSSKWIR